MPILHFRREYLPEIHLPEMHGATVNCAFTVCSSPVTTHSSASTNAAAILPSAEDPNERDPYTALDDYKQRMSMEITLGIVFVAVVVAVAIGLWIGLDKNLRKRMRRWGSTAVGCVTCRGHRARKDANQEPPSRHGPQRNGADPTGCLGPGKTMPLGPERAMRVMPCVLEAKSASEAGSTQSEKSASEAGSMQSEKSGNQTTRTALPVLPEIEI